jgi:CheY-like chemotaxis protein
VPSHDHESERSAVHELNNSLAAIAAFSHMIRTDPTLPEPLRHQADMLIEEAGRTRRIVEGLLGVARPTSEAVEPTRESVVAPAPAHEPTQDPARRLRVLVLDDEPAIRDFLGRILRRGGYEPVVASDGDSALQIVRDDPPDAILCDHRMAGMSGIAFHEAVAEIVPALARRFVFMSGDVLNPELSEFAVAQGVTLLAKPFDIESVDRAVAALMGPVQSGGSRGSRG